VDEDNATLLNVVDGLRANHAAPITHDIVEAHFTRARELARSGDTAAALKEYLWCFDEGMPRVSSYGGVREATY